MENMSALVTNKTTINNKTVYQYGKCFIFFYNIAQRNTKKGIFRVDIELRQHGS